MLHDETGQDSAEYALLVGAIAVVIVVAVGAVGVNLAALYDNIVASLAGAFP